MQQHSQAILEQALKLPPQDRAAVAEQLIQSLDPCQEVEVEQAWQQEIQRRILEMDQSGTSGVSWQDVQKRLTNGK